MTDESAFIDKGSLLLHFLEAIKERKALLIPRLLPEVEETLSLFLS